jgi:ABC-type nitrate/sulfonate/bicarbonate transport system substrate-binding protein
VRAVLAVVLLAAIACGGPPVSNPARPETSAEPVRTTAVPTGVAPIPLVLSYSALTASQSLPWIALETGLFAKHGLDIRELVYISSSAQGTAALLSGSVDAAVVGGVGIISAVIEGGDVKLIAGTKNQLAGKIMARPEIVSIEDLRGKRLAASGRGSNTEYMAVQVMRRSGMEVGRDFSFVYVGGNQETVAALTNDSAQAAASVPPDDRRLATAGAHELVDVTRLDLKYPATALAASGKSIREKPEGLRRLVASFKDAVQVYKNEPDTTLRIISKYTRIDDLEFLRPAYELERGIMADDVRVDPDAITAAIEDIAADKPDARRKGYTDFVDEQFLK